MIPQQIVVGAQRLLALGRDPVDMQWFTVHKNSDTELNIYKLATHRPPFDKNVLVMSANDSTEIMAIVEGYEPEEGIVVTVVVAKDGLLSQYPSVFYILNDEKLTFGVLDDEISTKFSTDVLALIVNWFHGLDAGCESYKPEIKKTFTNLRKAKQNKPVAYEWRTVVVQPPSVRKEHQGGTHASPRRHDRRGHQRKLSSGRTIWVKPCVVGNASDGRIFHDYEVRGQT